MRDETRKAWERLQKARERMRPLWDTPIRTAEEEMDFEVARHELGDAARAWSQAISIETPGTALGSGSETAPADPVPSPGI